MRNTIAIVAVLLMTSAGIAHAEGVNKRANKGTEAGAARGANPGRAVRTVDNGNNGFEGVIYRGAPPIVAMPPAERGGKKKHGGRDDENS